MRDDPWNTAHDYTECRQEAFLRGEDFIDPMSAFIDWWDNCDEEFQQDILNPSQTGT